MGKINVRDRNKGQGRQPNWEYRFEAAKINGKRQSVSRCGYRTKKEALDAGTMVYADYCNGNVHRNSTISLADYLEQWFNDYVVLNLSTNTQQTYRFVIDNHLSKLGNIKLSAISPAVLQRFIVSITDKSKSTIRTIYYVLKTSLDYAVEPLQLLKDNPCAKIRLPKKEDKKERTAYTKEQIKAILDYSYGTKYYIPILIGYYTGMRISEICALEWSDLCDNKLSVNKQLVYVKHPKCHYEISAPKTKSSVRAFFIAQELNNALQGLKCAQIANKEKHGAFYTDSNLICTDEFGLQVFPHQLRQYAIMIRRDLSIDFTFHSLRHTNATMLIESGANPKSVQQRLGHSSFQTTMNIYTHSTDKMDEETAKLQSNFSLGGQNVDK